MGENKWRGEKEWPLARAQDTNKLHPQRRQANTATGDGVLTTTAPRNEPTDAYTYDPANPVPSLGGNVCCSSVPTGSRDHKSIEHAARRPD